ncbi:MAG: hypothetical protein FWG72_01010 [Oscillospiraceae bacterium]|nr:hypothetical protein [Oscillospiraceae bacterium]
MTGKENRVWKRTANIALALALSLSLTLPATAREYSTGDSSTNPAKAAITKLFKMPFGTPTPESKFTFTFTKIGMDDPLDNSATALAGMPEIDDVYVTYAARENPVGGTFTIGGDRYAVKETPNFLKDMVGNVWGNGEGIYFYWVHEIETLPDSYITIDDEDKEGWAFSKAKYKVEIWVEKDSNNILFPKYVAVRIVPGSEDDYYTDENIPGHGKVDPTPGGEGKNPDDPTIEGDFSQVIFTNKYWKTDGGGEENYDESALEVIKKIKGSGSAADRDDKFFPFSVKVIQPGVIPVLDPVTGDPVIQVYKAYVMDEEDKIVTDSENGAFLGPDSNGGYFEFTSGETVEVALKHGQRLVFIDLHIGSAVEVTEDAVPGYIPSYRRTFSGTTFSDTKEYPGLVAHIEFGFPRDEDKGPHYTIEGVGANTVTFTNTRTGAIPTGVSVDDLPYIVLIALAIGGLVTFASGRSRRKSKIGK